MKQQIGTALGHVDILVIRAGGGIGASGNKPNPDTSLDISFADIQVLTNNNLTGSMLVC